MVNSDDLLNQDAFQSIVTRVLNEKNITHNEISRDMRQSNIVRDDLFFDLKRRHGNHKPDLMISLPPDIPCELKSQTELYKQCRYSYAHFVSYLLKTIYGQCLSYADLFRPDSDSQISIFLMVPKIVKSNVEGFDDIEGFFKDILSEDLPLYRRNMNLNNIDFSVPNFADPTQSMCYGTIGTEFVILVTLITYEMVQRGLVGS